MLAKLTAAPRDLLVVGIERLPTEGPYIGCRARDDEEDGHEPRGPGTIDAWQEPFPQNEVEHQRKNESYGDDQNPVQTMQKGRLIAGGHPPEVEREGGGEDEQDERKGGGACALEAEETCEDRREYPLHHE
jgi:hypothetical protein